MKQRKVIDSKQLPTQLPVTGTLVWYLILDKFNAPGWVWGVIGCLAAIVWVGVLVNIWSEKTIEIFELR